MYIEFKNVFQNPNLVNSYSKNKTDEDPLQRSKLISQINPTTSTACYFLFWILEHLKTISCVLPLFFFNPS